MIQEENMRQTIRHLFLSFISLVFLASCSQSEYRQSIPRECSALASFDVSQLSGTNNKLLLKTLLHINNADESGIDLTQKIYLFESPDGNIGICARISNVDKWEKILSKSGIVSKTFRDAHFAQVNTSWIAGYTDNSLLLMGPITPANQPEIRNKMAEYLQQKEDNSVLVSPIYAKLDSINSPMAMVAQVQALPEQLTTLMTIGSPKDADGTDVLLSANMHVDHHCLLVNGKLFSFNQTINNELKKSMEVYRPIKGDYLPSMSRKALLGIFVNVNGKSYLPLLQNSKGLQAILVGINQAIDFDNIVKSVDGDMAIVIPSFNTNQVQMSMAAKLAHTHWLKDVNYWKQSVPKGGRLTNWGKNAFSYADGKQAFYFGVTDDKQFYSGNSREAALASIHPAPDAISQDVQTQLKGEKMAMVINLQNVENKTVNMFSSLLKPVFGDINTVVYKLK